MKEFAPYIVSVICALISFASSCLVVRRETKNEIEKIVKQHEVDLDALERKHQMEIEKINLEYAHQLELKDKEFSANMSSTLLTEAMRLPEVRQKISQGVKKGRK